jgi:hypothetical protein
MLMDSNKVLAFENGHYRYFSTFAKDKEKDDYRKDMQSLKEKMIKNGTHSLDHHAEILRKNEK